MYKKYYSKFLSANKNIQHYACHSHHYWPDVTFDASIEYWNDSAQYVDDKWDHIFSTKLPETQKMIAEILNISNPNQIAFAPNTHEFVMRIISCLDPKKQNRVLTTDSEFYSFDRQINRYIDEDLLVVDKVATQPFDNFTANFIKKINENDYDLIFLSHVFFNSGMVVDDLEKIVNACKNPNTIIVIDGYHGFMAIPTNLKAIEDRIFYLAGSYKYAQGGEGCCFLISPKNSTLRPLYTGWFAGFSSLAADGSKTTYSGDGFRFAGSTMDYSALYRLNAVLKLFKSIDLTVDKIHAHVQMQQKNFRNHLLEIDHSFLTEKNILSVNYNHHGHFLTFAMPSPEHTIKLHNELKAIGVHTDYRGSRLRFGFAIYQNDCIDLTQLAKNL